MFNSFDFCMHMAYIYFALIEGFLKSKRHCKDMV